MHTRTSKKLRHGTHSCYSKGCRCEPCTVAHRDYSREMQRRVRRVKQGLEDPPPPRTVDATVTRKHLQFLAKRGIGTQYIQEKTGMHRRNISNIRSGRQKNVLRETETRILNVLTHDLSDNHYVDPKYTLMLLKEIYDAGYSLADVNRLRKVKMPSQPVVTGNSIRLRKQKEIEKIHFFLLRRPPLFDKPKTKRKGQLGK